MADAKEYLRNAFLSGALDVTTDYENVCEFVQIFVGEPEATRAIEQCHFLSPKQTSALRKLAGGT